MYASRVQAVFLCALMLAACARDAGDERALNLAAEASTSAEPTEESAKRRPGASLAYEHEVTVELSKNLLPERLKELQAACTSREELSCTLLDVSFQRRLTVPGGSIRMRVAPAAVEPLVQIAAKGGEVTLRTTHAEDLAEPVADTERTLAMLTSQREQLERFTKTKDLPVDQLITVTKELASVQTQVDALSTQRANLQRRIDTELLTINLSLPLAATQAEEAPILDALRSFGADFRTAVAGIISFLAVLLPWLVVIVPGLIFVRLFWRWITRWLARREARTGTLGQ